MYTWVVMTKLIKLFASLLGMSSSSPCEDWDFKLCDFRIHNPNGRWVCLGSKGDWSLCWSYDTLITSWPNKQMGFTSSAPIETRSKKSRLIKNLARFLNLLETILALITNYMYYMMAFEITEFQDFKICLGQCMCPPIISLSYPLLVVCLGRSTA